MKAPPNLDLKNRRQGRMSSTEIAEAVKHQTSKTPLHQPNMAHLFILEV